MLFRSCYVSYFDGTYGFGNGTSFSCPILAGAAACLWQAHPNMNNIQIKQAVEQSACYASNPGDSLGYGIPDFMSAHLQLGGTVLQHPVSDEVLNVFPNPANEVLWIDYYTPESGDMMLCLYDPAGRLCLRRHQTVEGWVINSLKLPVGELEIGRAHV